MRIPAAPPNGRSAPPACSAGHVTTLADPAVGLIVGASLKVPPGIPTITVQGRIRDATEVGTDMTASGRSIRTADARSVIFVEGFRLLFVLAGAVAGFEIGKTLAPADRSRWSGLLLGAGVSYVIGGIGGRLLDKGLQRAVFLFRNTPPGEVFAASIISTTGMLLGLVVGLPVVRHHPIGLCLGQCTAFAMVGTWHARMAARLDQGRQIVAAADLSRILAPHPDPPRITPSLVEGSAVMDRFLVVLGPRRAPAGRCSSCRSSSSITCAPWPSRRSRSAPAGPPRARVTRGTAGDVGPRPCRARRGSRGRRPHDQAPDGGPSTGLRIGRARRRCIESAATWELPVVDLRTVATELSPDHLPGEGLVVDLVREGRQPRQAVGYLPDGDMVVVNDATHLIDRARSVSSGALHPADHPGSHGLHQARRGIGGSSRAGGGPRADPSGRGGSRPLLIRVARPRTARRSRWR